jgi:hypothetical protein
MSGLFSTYTSMSEILFQVGWPRKEFRIIRKKHLSLGNPVQVFLMEILI